MKETAELSANVGGGDMFVARGRFFLIYRDKVMIVFFPARSHVQHQKSMDSATHFPYDAAFPILTPFVPESAFRH